MAPHPSILVCRSPWTEEPGRLQSMGSQKTRTWLSIRLRARQGKAMRVINKQKQKQFRLTKIYFSHQFSSVQSLSRVQRFATPWIAASQTSLSITNTQSLPKLKSIESVMPSSHLILCRPFLLLPPIPPSIWVFSNESTLHMRWPKYWSFSFNISPSNEYLEDSFPLGLTGFILLQSKWLSRIFSNTTSQKHQFFGAQLSLWSTFHIHTWLLEKIIALTRWTFIGKIMSLLLNVLSRLVTAFLPRS